MSLNMIKKCKTKEEKKQTNILNINSNKSEQKKRLSFRWVESLKSSKKLKNDEDNKYSFKKDLNIKEMIDNAKIHREANRPLKKIKDFSSFTKFCQCCYLPVKDNIYMRNFNFCENTDEYAECGMGTSLYFSFYRFSILILIFAIFMMGIPSLFITNHFTNHLIDICYKIYDIEQENINTTFSDCLEFIDIGKSEFFSKDIYWILKFNSINLKIYKEMYYNLSEPNENVDKTLINYSLSYFIGLISLFIINILYIILLYNLNKQYDISITSPSDYTVIITNLLSAFHIFWKKINKINDYIKNNNDNNKDISINDIEYQNESNSSQMKEIEELGLEDLPKGKEINILEAFHKFIINKICETPNGEKFNVYQINICYKINELTKIDEKIQTKKDEIYKINNEPFQKIKNEKLELTDKNRKYFYYPFDIFKLNIFPFNLCEKYCILSDIEEEKNKLEIKLKELQQQTEILTEDNFSGAIFVTFDSMKDQKNFLEPYPKNIIMTIFVLIKDLKYYLCFCCIDKHKKKNFLIKRHISISSAPEPEDVIFENLQYSSYERFVRVIFIYLISFVVIFICFIIILGLNYLQINYNEGDNENKVIVKYIMSISISLIISIVNKIFHSLLDYITKKEKQISMTNYYLSYSVKLTLFTFITSAIIPLISSYYYLSEVNHDILITNMLTIFLSNSFLTPLMWSLNFEFLLRKLKICLVEKKNIYYSQKELNKLYELLDMGVAYKYSYISKSILMTFFYLPIFPLGILFTLLGFIFGYFLEKFNFSKLYKKPEMLNGKISEFYSNYFILNFFMLCIGNYIFLKEVYKFNLWSISILIIFGVLLIIPYNQILVFDFIGINESELKKNEKYEDYYFSFYNDYERNNPMTKKEGIKHFLNKLIENALINKKDYDIILQNIENINLMETYYKARINFSNNLIQKAFLNLGEDSKNKNIRSRRKSKFIENFKQFSKSHKDKTINRLLFPINIFGNLMKENSDENHELNNINLSINKNNEKNININQNNNNIYKGPSNIFNNNNNINIIINRRKNEKINDFNEKIQDDSKNQLIYNIKNKSNNIINNSDHNKIKNNTNLGQSERCNIIGQ